MAQFNNWVAANWQKDVLPPDIARTVLNFIKTYEAYVASLGLDDLMTQFAEHAADKNNPHKVRINNLPDLIVDAIWNYYSTNTLPVLGDNAVIKTRADMEAAFEANPVFLLESMRAIILNTDFKYQDGAGTFLQTFPGNDAFYRDPDPSPKGYPIPYYVSDHVNPDLNYYIEGKPTGYLSAPMTTDYFTITGTFKIAAVDRDRAVWMLIISPDGSGNNAFTVVYVAATKSLQIASNVPELVLMNGGFNFKLNSDLTKSYTETRFALTFTPTGLTAYAYQDGGLVSQSDTWSLPGTMASMKKYVLSHAMSDNQTDATATMSLKLYPAIYNPRTIKALLDGEY